MIAAFLLASIALGRAARAGPACWSDGPPGLVLVPGGKTKIGTEESEVEHWISDPEARAYAGALSAETPRHDVEVASFWLMTTEVTNEQYASFVRATGARPPETWGEKRIAGGRARHLEDEDRARAQAVAQGKLAPESVPFDSHAWWLAHWREAPRADAGADEPAWEVPRGDEARPVVFVDWGDACAYARWAGLRLPTELEYERAVRGDTARSYPWGNDWEDGRYAATLVPGTRTGAMPVGSFPAGASRQGVFDLAGNVWEWTSSEYAPFPGYQLHVYDVGFASARKKINALADWNAEQRVVVGGSFRNGRMMARATTRRAADRGQAADALGFRCAASLRPGYDAAIAVLAQISPVAPLRDARGPIEFAPELVACADGWTTAAPAAPAASGTRPEGYAVIAEYRRVLFVPVRVLPAYDPGGLEKLTAAEDLVALGCLSIDAPTADPDLAPGTYAVYWRGKGVRAFTPSAPIGTQEVPVVEALHLDTTVDQLVFADPSGRPVASAPAHLEWENLRECRIALVDLPSAPRTGGDPWPPGTRIFRIEGCAPCRASQKGFAFAANLRFAPGAFSASWRPR